MLKHAAWSTKLWGLVGLMLETGEAWPGTEQLKLWFGRASFRPIGERLCVF